ncbi:MAG TPA: hypothetical protein VJJ73_02185 [Candidatus Paceibacterota bacterium]
MKRNREKRFYSPTKQKILLLLAAGVALSFTRSPKANNRVLKSLSKEWKYIRRDYLYRTLDEFYNNRLIAWEEEADGSIRAILAERGEKRILKFRLDQMEIRKPKQWDKKWRIVFFDIPEKMKLGRNALREKLKELGFCEAQKSIYLFPHECKDEIDFIVEFFDARRFVHYAEVSNLTNEAKFKLHFSLS